MADFGDEGFDREGGRYEFQGRYNPADPSVANGMITPEQWAEYQRKRKRAALIGYLGTIGGMLGAQPLANAIGIGSGATGAAGSAASGMPPGYVPGWEGNTGIIGGAAGGAAGGAGVGAAGGGAGAGAAAGGFGLRDALGLGLGVAGTIGGAMSDRPDYSPNSAATDPAMQELLQLMAGRLKKSEPLYDSVMAMANGLLPTQYQKGGGGMG
jgi:hypothetical protein